MPSVPRPASDPALKRRKGAFAAAALLVLLVICLTAWLHGVYVERENRHRHQAERELQSINQLQLQAVVGWQQQSLRDAEMLVEDTLLSAALGRWLGDGEVSAREGVRRRLRALNELGHYTAVHFVDSAGTVLLSNRADDGREGTRVPLADLGALRSALSSAKAVMAEPVSDRAFAFPFISVFAPLYDDEVAIGAVWLVQDLRSALLPLLEPWPTPSQTARSGIVWRDGEQARYLNAPREVKAAVLQYRYPLEGNPAAVVQALGGVRGVFYASDEQGRAVMAMASPVFGTRWLLLSSVEVAEVFADVRRREILALALPVSLLLLASAGVFGLVLRRAWQRERVLTQALQRSLGGLEAQLRVDPLTGVANRRALDEAASFQLALAVRGETPLALLMIDVDHFKLYNDHYGHPAGDQCLKTLAAALQAHVGRAGELVARYGGEEFAVLLPLTDGKAALDLAQRMCEAVRRLQIPHAASTVASHATVSIGVAWLKADAVTVEYARTHRVAPEGGPEGGLEWPLMRELFEQADAALYEAKRLGRDQAVLYVDPDGEVR
ncbi:GGDEF domain-containing protein [Thauera sp. 63]|uniref:GGDEF domain-containing protein n=1 Tax=Thauera sp. 63 TaxID=497321 RepID=UPI0012FC4AB6|nr:GGDEF domain-containing protein [Thauera sp. 63]